MILYESEIFIHSSEMTIITIKSYKTTIIQNTNNRQQTMISGYYFSKRV